MPNPTLSIDLREQLARLQQDGRAIETAISQFNRRYEKLTDCLERTGYTPQDSTLTTEEIAQLLQLNRALRTLQDFLSTLTDTVCSGLDKKIADPNDQMADYECDIELNYTLRTNDPEWSDDSDNFVTKRRLLALGQRNEEFAIDDWRVFVPGLQHINSEPHCWLFHDLHDHAYGLDQPSVSLRDCLRLGEVWVDVIIRQQYWFNLDTGTWEKSFPPQNNASPQQDIGSVLS